jgi:putative Ca2+/H+ antiporter (TMEM165/GDT1 family)
MMSLTAGAMGCPLALRPTSRAAAKRRVSSKVRRAAPARASSFDPLDVAASKSTSAARQVLFPEIVGSTPREWIASASRLGADVAEGDHDAKGAEVIRSGSTKSSMATAAGVLALAGLAVAPDAFAASVATIADATEAVEATGGLLDGFLQAFLLIFFSEIGDKTFFIAVILATQQDKATVFAGTFGALAVMTVISVGIGQVFHIAEEATTQLAGSNWDDYLAVALLLVFGIQTILGAEEDTAEEEEEDAKVAVAGMQFDGNAALVISTFALVFAAEWGDKVSLLQQ